MANSTASQVILDFDTPQQAKLFVDWFVNLGMAESFLENYEHSVGAPDSYEFQPASLKYPNFVHFHFKRT